MYTSMQKYRVGQESLAKALSLLQAIRVGEIPLSLPETELAGELSSISPFSKVLMFKTHDMSVDWLPAQTSLPGKKTDEACG